MSISTNKTAHNIDMHFNHIPPAIDTARPTLTSNNEKSINSKIIDSDHVIAII